MYMKKKFDRGFKDLSIFEIGPVFTGSNPGEQNTVVCGFIDQVKNQDYLGLRKKEMLMYLMLKEM